MDICKKNNIHLEYSDTLKIFEIFDKINKVIPELNYNRNRIISSQIYIETDI